ncbi:hypothetical protein DL765_003308 [Monosporascus sp. GIB2]|nr:hypothetical protein DL765_003308 [Monosporascus sp. GIB2]
MGEQMDQDDFWAQFEPDEFLADDTIETRSERPSTEPSQAFDDTRNVSSTRPHCWINSVGKKHYKLRTHHLKSLIKHVQQGGTLQTHDDVPGEVREQLYAEEQQDGERQRKRRGLSSLASCPPINIINVLPA